jgi:predicted methyltransferase
MEENKLYLLLDVIFKNGSVKKLTREGITFSEIAIETNNAIENELVTNNNEKIILTEKGIELLKALETRFKKTNKSEWIEKDLKNKIPKLDKNLLFLPSQNELSF